MWLRKPNYFKNYKLSLSTWRPCSIWMVPKLQVFKSSDAPYDFGCRLCIHFFLVQKIDKTVRIIKMANHNMQNSFNLQSKWYTGIALAFRIKVKVTFWVFGKFSDLYYWIIPSSYTYLYILVAAIFSPTSVSRDRESRPYSN